MYKKTIFLILCILLCYSVVANTVWIQEANADLNLPGGNGLLGYGSNLNNLLENVSYTKCSIPGTVWPPIGSDFTGDGQPELILFETNKMSLYNLDCTLLAEQSLGENPNAPGVIINHDSDGNPDIAILLDSTLELYEYNNLTNSFVSYKSIATLSTDEYLVCTRQFTGTNNGSCFSGDYNTDDYVWYDLDNDATHQSLAQHNLDLLSPQSLGNKRTGWSSARTFGNTNFLIPICTTGPTNNDRVCHIFNSTANNTGVSWTVGLEASASISKTYHDSAFIARMGNVYRVFHTLSYAKSTTNMRWQSEVHDLSGNLLYQLTDPGDSNINESSNWMVADWDKNGLNDACLIYNSSADNLVHFQCWDENFGTPLHDHDISGIVNYDFSQDWVMADFLPNSSFLGIANSHGIYYFDGVTWKQNFDSELARDGWNGTSIVLSYPQSGSPNLVYTDFTTGFIARNLDVAEECGNGVCDYWESSFSCPVDCGVASDAECLQNSDCPTSYPTCLNEHCVSGYNASLTCNFNSDCPYNAPICYAGFCVSGFSAGLPDDIDDSTEVDDEIETAMNNVINMLTGGNATVKFIVGVIILFGVLATAYKFGLKSPFILTMMSVIISIVNSMLGLWPIVIPAITIIAMVVLYLLNMQTRATSQ